MNFSDASVNTLYQNLKNVVKQMYAQGEFQNAPYKFDSHFLRQSNVIGTDELQNLRNQWFQESVTHFHNDVEIHPNHLNHPNDTDAVSMGYIKKFKCKFSIVHAENANNTIPFVLTITLVKDQDENFTLNAEIKSPKDTMNQKFIYTAGTMFLRYGKSEREILDTFQNIYMQVPMCQWQDHDASMAVISTETWVKNYKTIKNYYKDAELKRLLIVKNLQKYMSDDTIDTFVRPALDHNLSRQEYFLQRLP